MRPFTCIIICIAVAVLAQANAHFHSANNVISTGPPEHARQYSMRIPVTGAEWATGAVLGVTDIAAHIMDTVRDQNAKSKASARTENNEFNIRKNFLDNAVNAIQMATRGQYNIVICTDQQKDDFQNLKGRVLPMELLEVELSQGKVVNFEVYVFETGKYLRHGRWERDSLWYFGESKVWYDPFAMHVDFDTHRMAQD